jgi:hypothetical protein
MLDSSGSANRILLVTTTAMFAVTTCHVVFSLSELIKGFIVEPVHHPEDPQSATAAYFLTLAEPLDVGKLSLYEVNVRPLLVIFLAERF